jgi:multicomponent Na+:H+ antiporter subunit B
MKDGIQVKNVIQPCGVDLILPLALVYIGYIILHGHLSPGGGFQGGVLVVGMVVMLYLGRGYETTVRALSANLLHETEGIASIVYIALAMMGVAVGAQFCQNILYQQGAAGDLYSTGTIFWMNITVGVKVFTGIGSIALLMLSLVAGKSEEKE